MSATVSVELYTPEDKEAFAAFLTASATADRARPKDYYGGIAGALDPNWQTGAGSGEQSADEGTSTSDVSSLSASAADTTPQRERGKPGQGRARRTKEEIAEDEAADKADAATAAAGAETGGEVADRQISTSPEDRKDAEQDAADEAAETAAASTGKLTHDDARGALGAYVKAYGMPAALEDGPKVLTMLFGPDITKVSAIPDDQESLAKAVAGINEMTTKNPFSRTADL